LGSDDLRRAINAALFHLVVNGEWLNDSASKGHGHRCTQIVDSSLPNLVQQYALTPKTFHFDDYAIQTAYARERDDTFPAREEFYVTAPATIAARARYGIPWFDQRWSALDQNSLFN